MRSAAPTIENFGWSGAAVLDKNAHEDGGDGTYAYGSGMILCRSCRREESVVRPNIDAWNDADRSYLVPETGVPLHAFEVQCQLQFMGAPTPASSTSMTGSFQPGIGNVGIQLWAVSGNATGGVVAPTRAVSASGAQVDASIGLGRLLGEFAPVGRIPVSFHLQPGERVYALALWSCWDLSAQGTYGAFVSINVSCEQQA